MTTELTREQIIETVIAYEKELRDFADEMSKAFGREDKATERVLAQWVTVALLLDKLELIETV
jgi:ribosomal protein L17